MLGRSALRTDCTAMLGLGSRRRTHCAHCVRFVQTAATSQSWMRAARADPRPALLVAPEIAPAEHRLPRGCRIGVCDEDHDAAAKVHPGRRRCAWEALTSRAVAARAARFANDSARLSNGVSAASEASLRQATVATSASEPSPHRRPTPSRSRAARVGLRSTVSCGQLLIETVSDVDCYTVRNRIRAAVTPRGILNSPSLS